MLRAFLRGVTAFFAACMLMPAAVFAVTEAEPAAAPVDIETATTITTAYAPALTEPVTTHSEWMRYSVQIVDAETQELLPDAEVRLEKRFYIQAGSSTQIPTGEVATAESWNTSDENPYLSGEYHFTGRKRFYMYAVIDKMPEGYSYLGRTTCEVKLVGHPIDTEISPTTIKLRREKYYYYDGFPVTGTYSLEVAIFDGDNGALLPGLDCVVTRDDTGEEVFRCTTSATETFVIPELEYRFENWQMFDAIQYTLRILNMPENYTLGRRNVRLQSYYVEAWENGTTYLRQPIALWRTDMPIDPGGDLLPATTTATETTTTTASTETTTTASTETTAIVTTEDTATLTPQPTTVTAQISVDLTTSAAASTETTTTSTAALSDLPQTGSNDPRGAFLFALSLGLTAVGTAAVLHRETE